MIKENRNSNNDHRTRSKWHFKKLSRWCEVILRTWMLAAVITTFVGVSASTQEAVAQLVFTEESGTLADGTEYRMRAPSNWNGTLINDLDYAGAADNDRNLYLLERGYALSGTKRHALRRYQYDPAKEISNLITVLDMFEERFGKPDRVIQYGHSGGGNIALAMGELHPERVDGVIPGCAHTSVWLTNTYLDGWFVLKALLAPHLTIVNLPDDHSAITVAWREVFSAAQQTPEGRARIALAFTIGQWPAWTSATTPEPDPRDVEALQYSMYETVYYAAGQPGGQSRFMFEVQGQLSWNTGIDYMEFFNNGNEFQKRAVRKLYEEAGLDLRDDIDRINAFPRISADTSAIEFWSETGRHAVGKPQVPMLRIHTIGDILVPPSLIQGYEAAVRSNGLNDLYRSAIVDSAGHCNFSVAESVAAIETLMYRLDSGRWKSSTHPKQLNDLATSLDAGPARFIPLVLDKYNRPWFPEE